MKKLVLNTIKIQKPYLEYSSDMIYKNIDEYNPGKIQEILIKFDDMIADIISNKKVNPIVTELFV